MNILKNDSKQPKALKLMLNKSFKRKNSNSGPCHVTEQPHIQATILTTRVKNHLLK